MFETLSSAPHKFHTWKSNEAGVVKGQGNHLFTSILHSEYSYVIFEYHEDSMIVLFLVRKLQIMDRN